MPEWAWVAIGYVVFVALFVLGWGRALRGIDKMEGR